MRFIHLKNIIFLVATIAIAAGSVGLYRSLFRQPKLTSLPAVSSTASPSPTATVSPTASITKNALTSPTPTRLVSSPTSTPTPSSSNQGGIGGANTTSTPQPTSPPITEAQTPTPTATPTNTPVPTTTPTPTPTPTPAPVNPGFTVSPNALNLTIGTRARIENAFTVSYAGADSFELTVSLWHGGFVFSPSVSALSPGQSVNIALQTYGPPTGVTNGTATFKNPVNGATIDIPIHLTVN